MRIFDSMKARLNITIDSMLLDEMKIYSTSKNISLSQLIEEYFGTIVRKKKKKAELINMVEALPPHGLDKTANLIDSYYSDKYNADGR